MLSFRERELRARHHLTLNAGTAYARTLRLLGRYRDATSSQELNARLHLQVMGPHTPQTLRAEHNLALCLRRSGEVTRAATLLADLVERSRRVLGPRHPETLMVRADHATFLREHGDLGHARDLAEEVAERYRALAGERHPYTVGTLGNVGLVRGEFGDPADALDLAERALSGMAEAMGPGHPWTLGCALNAAAARNRVDDEEGAVELGRDTLERAKARLGDTHPLTLSAKTALSEDLRALRRGRGGGEARTGGHPAALREPGRRASAHPVRPAAPPPVLGLRTAARLDLTRGSPHACGRARPHRGRALPLVPAGSPAARTLRRRRPPRPAVPALPGGAWRSRRPATRSAAARCGAGARRAGHRRRRRGRGGRSG